LEYFNLIWVLLIFWGLVPLYQRRRIQAARFRAIDSIQRRRGSRVITLIHRQEALSILGIPVSRHIDIEDSEQVLRAVRMTPQDVPVDVIVHSPGGLVLAAEQIAHAIKRHRAKVTVFVPHYAMSGGTLIALGADEIVMDDNAVLGPVDPQVGGMPAASIVAAVEAKGVGRTGDRTLVLADVAHKALVQMRRAVEELLADKMPSEQAREVAAALTEGRWTHDYPLDCAQLRRLGLKVSCDMPTDVFQLMDLYPQPAGRRPSVQYVPLPARALEDD